MVCLLFCLFYSDVSLSSVNSKVSHQPKENVPQLELCIERLDFFDTNEVISTPNLSFFLFDLSLERNLCRSLCETSSDA